MPSNAKQIEQEIQALSRALRELSEVTGDGAEKFIVYADVLERLNPKAAIAGYAEIKGSLKEVTGLVESLGKQFGVSKTKADAMVNSLKRLQAVGRLRFQAPKGGTQPEDITLGQDTLQIGEHIGTPEFQQAIRGGARAIESVQQALDRMNVGVVRKLRLEMFNMTSVTEDAGRKLTTWTASVEDTGLPTRRAVIVTNELGNVVKSTSRQFTSFGSSIVRNIGKVAQWTIAIAIVYAPIQKLTQIMQEAVQVEVSLADAQIVLGTSTAQLNEIWKNSAKIARELGVSTDGVVDGYVLAARAAANIQNPTERANATVAVLRDSMLLAKLAGIDQAIAMDTLVGALRQLKRPLTDGTELLDKWVAVSKVANVSIATLAESFAITATAAEGVGITVDKLNGIIAAVAEVTTLSATESGNAVRAFISGFQKDQTERELNRFGISVRDVNGELRNFISIIDDIIARRDVGLISDRELAKISEFIGGGARRGAQINAILENYGRVQELAAVSAKANGDATEALGIKMDTVQTAAQNLNNAFTELAKALGGDAGFLDSAQSALKIMTGVVDIFTSVTQVLGKATPALIAFSAAFLTLRHSTRLQKLLELPLFQFAGRIPFIGGALSEQISGRAGMGALEPTGQAAGGFFGRGGGALGGAAIGLGAAALSGKSLFGSPADLRRTGTTVGAAAVSQFLAGGSPIGGLIGATVVQTIFSNLIDRETDLTSAFTRIFTGSFKTLTEEDRKNEAIKTKDERDAELFALLGGRLEAGLVAAASEKKFRPSEEGIENAVLVLADLATAELEQSQLPLFTLLFDLSLSEEEKARIREIIQEMKAEALAEAKTETPQREGTPFARAIVETGLGAGSTAQRIFRERRGQVIGEVGRGQRGVRELRELEDLGQVFDNQMDTIFAAMTLNAGQAAASYEDTAQVVISASEEERKGIIDLANGVGVLFNEFKELQDAGEGMGILTIMIEKVTAAQDKLNQIIQLTDEAQRFRAFKQPQFIEVDPEAAIEDLQLAVDNAQVVSQSFLDSLTPDEAEQAKVIDTWGQLGLLNAEAWIVAMQGITGVSREILEGELEDLGLLAEEAGQIGILTPDITREQFREEAARRLPGINALIEQIRPLDKEEMGFIFKDNFTDIIHADQLAIQLLLRDIKELNEDQLEGIFNIPEGMTALIPFTGRLFFSDQPIGEPGGGFGALGENIDVQTDILHTDLEKIDASIQEQKFLEEDAITRSEEGLDIDFEQLGRDFDAFKAAELEAKDGRFLAGRGVNRVEEEEPTPRSLIGVELLSRGFQGLDTMLGGLFSQLITDIGQALSGVGGVPTSEAAEEEINRLNIRVLSPEINSLIIRVRSLEEKSTANARQFITENPEFKTMDIFRTEGLQGIQEILQATLPQSIPVTINTKITNPVTVLIDGRQLTEAISERSFQDLESATRRAGALGYVME